MRGATSGRKRLLWLAAALGLLFHCSAVMAAADQNQEPKPELLSFQSGGVKIQVERYQPAGAVKVPAVILIHGADGLQFERWAKIYGRMAARIAEQGYWVYLPHYFERTRTKFGDPISMVRHFVTWSATISDCAKFVRNEHEQKPIGLVGVSLGATLAVTIGAKNSSVACVVEFFGGTPGWLPPLLEKMPPTLILHGDADRIVKVEEAYKLEKALKEHQRVYEIKIYPGQGHGFSGEAEADAMRRTTAFLDRYLRPASARG